MAEHHADLNLYFGLCTIDGFIGEGRFEMNAKDDWSMRRHMEAMDNVRRYLSPEWDFGLIVAGDRLVSSEQEAVRLIEYAESNIPKSGGLIELVDAMHGKIRFYRKIRFDGAIENQREELIGKMKQSGYVPKPPQDAFLAHLAGIFAKSYQGEALEQKLREIGFGPDHSWHKALQFF